MTNMMKYLKMIALMVISVAVIAVSADALTAKNEKTSEIKQEEIVGEKTVITDEIIRDSIRDVGLLVTKEYAYTEIETYSDQYEIKGHKIPFTETSFSFSYNGKICAGIDFEKANVILNKEHKMIIIILPDPIIISKELDTDSFCLLDQKNSIFNPMTMEDANISIKALEDHAVKSALQKGLMEGATENAEVLLRNFLKGNLNLAGYSISFAEK